MSDVHTLAIDRAKQTFQACATDRSGTATFRWSCSP